MTKQFTTSAKLRKSKEENLRNATVGWSNRICPDDGRRLGIVPVRFSDLKELVCPLCGYTEPIPYSVVQSDGSEFDGHGPDEAIVMDSNLGAAPGPQRTSQIMSALNQDRTTPRRGLDFHLAKLDLLTLWGMSSNSTDRITSQILKTTVKTIEKKRNVKLDPARIDAIARACKAGIRKAELKKRLARWELEGAIQGVFKKEGLWPP